MIKWPLHVEFSVAIFSWSSGHLKLPKQKALTKHNRLVSAIVRVSMVTVVAAENLVHFEDWNSEALVESNLQAETPGACCMLLGWAYLSSLVCSTHYKLLHAPLALLCSLHLGIFKRPLGFDWSINTFGMPQHYCVRVDCSHILSISFKCNYYAVSEYWKV